MWCTNWTGSDLSPECLKQCQGTMHTLRIFRWLSENNILLGFSQFSNQPRFSWMFCVEVLLFMLVMLLFWDTGGNWNDWRFIIVFYSMAALINATYHFKNIFNSSGYLLVMPSIIQIYNNNLSNHLVTSSIEFLIKQLYILHRKPFLLQMFGSIANLLETRSISFEDPFKINSTGFSFHII